MKYSKKNLLMKTNRQKESWDTCLLLYATQYMGRYFHCAYTGEKLHVKWDTGIANPEGGKGWYLPHLAHIIAKDSCGEDSFDNYMFLADEKNVRLSSNTLVHAAYLAAMEGETVDGRTFAELIGPKYAIYKDSGVMGWYWPLYLCFANDRGTLGPLLPGVNLRTWEVDREVAQIGIAKAKTRKIMKYLERVGDCKNSERVREQYETIYRMSPEKMMKVKG
jgi:hypothetical protein